MLVLTGCALLADLSVTGSLQAGIFASAGVDKIRLTGGEPTLRRDLVELTAALRALPGVNAVGITTNGITLSRKLSALQAAGMLCWGLLFLIHVRMLSVDVRIVSTSGRVTAAETF